MAFLEPLNRLLSLVAMITAMHIRRMIEAKPFKPFRAYIKGGRVFDIRFPEINMVTQSTFIIGIPEPNDTDPFADHFVRFGIEMVDHVEPIVDEAAIS